MTSTVSLSKTGALRLLAASLLAGGIAHADPQIAFDTDGGDAWTFELQVSGRAAREQCDAVLVSSPLGSWHATQSHDRFDAHVTLRSGENEVTATCRKRGREVARSQPQRWRVPLQQVPKAWIRLRTTGRSIALDAGRSEPATAEPAPLVQYQWRARAGNPAALTLLDGRLLDAQTGILAPAIELAVPQRDGEYHVLLQVTDAAGRIDRSAHMFRVAAGRAVEIDLRTQHPAWVDAAVVYGAAPYFFTPAGFAGIVERLDEIAALGATAVWLSPVTTAAPDDFGYAVTDQFELREQFGGERGFRALVDHAHRLGLRVLVDFVPNHLSEHSAYYRDAAARGARSPYYRWFDRDAAGRVTQYFDWTHLKNLDYDNPQVRGYVTAAFARFVRELDVDGFRVDASWAVAQRAPEFWPQLRAELKRIDPDILLLAEASAREPYHFANGFDAAYDWTAQLGEWAWRAAFREDGTVDVAMLRAALTNDGAGFPDDALMLRFLNNNDTGARFVTRFGVPLAKLAATMLFTLPGLPLIYNGDEAGAAFQPYDEGPPIQWNDGGDLAQHYRRLTQLRRDTPALSSREIQLLRTDQDQAVLAYVRPASAAGGEVLVLLNFTGRPVTVRPGDASARETFKQFARARDLLSDESRVRRTDFRLAPLSARVLSR